MSALTCLQLSDGCYSGDSMGKSHKRKQIFCTRKWGKISRLQHMWSGRHWNQLKAKRSSITQNYSAQHSLVNILPYFLSFSLRHFYWSSEQQSYCLRHVNSMTSDIPTVKWMFSTEIQPRFCLKLVWPCNHFTHRILPLPLVLNDASKGRDGDPVPVTASDLGNGSHTIWELTRKR